MKIPHLLLMLGLFLFSLSCKKDEDATISSNTKSTLTAPPGFEISALTIPDNISGINKIHFLDEQNGFLLPNFNPNEIVGIFKTEDGGLSWSELGNIPNLGNDFLFFDQQEGIIALNGLASFLRTEDGGRTWKNHSFPEFGSWIQDIQMDINGNLFGISFKQIGNSRVSEALLLRSQDRGVSWEVIYFFDDFVDNAELYLDFQVIGEHLYIVDFTGLNQLDSDGNRIKTIPINGTEHFREIKLIDEDHWVVSKYDEIIKTDDGGDTWKQINADEGTIIDFTSPEQGLMILQSSSASSTDDIDVLAYTEDGGNSWMAGTVFPDFLFKIEHQKIAEGHYLLLINDTLCRLKKL